MISVIIPIFNAEAYICRCLDSVLLQSFTDWECILVDDGSQDKSGEICDKYAIIDSRFRVIHKENGGVSSARNAGMELAKGEWISFVDCDDWLLDNYLSSLSSAVSRQKEIDLVGCGFCIVKPQNNELFSYSSRIYIGINQIHSLLAETNFLQRGYPWARLFKRCIIQEHSIKFNTSISLSEDRLFLYQYLRYTEGIAVTSSIAYIYNSLNVHSLSNRSYPLEMLSLRQKLMTEYSFELIERYMLSNEELYMLVEQLAHILLHTIICAFSEFGYSSKTVLVQEKLFCDYWRSEFNEPLRGSIRWCHYIKSNPLMRKMLQSDFQGINRSLYCWGVKQRILKFAKKNSPKRNQFESRSPICFINTLV